MEAQAKLERAIKMLKFLHEMAIFHKLGKNSAGWGKLLQECLNQIGEHELEEEKGNYRNDL